MKTFLGYTLIGWFNLLILQWFFVRLFYVEEEDGTISGWGLNFPVLPLTGWWSNYIPAKPFKWKM